MEVSVLKTTILRLVALLALVSAHSLFAICPDFRYAPTYRIATDLSPASLPTGAAVGDFNGDGKLDVATSNTYEHKVSILLGNGDGSFPAPVHYGSHYGYAIVTADFNGDGKLDLAVTNGSENGVDIFIGTGTGTFGAPTTVPTGPAEVNTTPYSLAAADFNGDGKMDLVTGNSGTANMSLLLGNGNGTFGAFTHLDVGGSPSHIAVGDLNNDSKMDIAVTRQSSTVVAVRSGNGNGTFESVVSYAMGEAGAVYTNAVAIGDFNGDGFRDLAAANDDAVAIRLNNNGNGTFADVVTYPAIGRPAHLALGDLNGDTKLDVVTANGYADASVFFGNGDGTLDPALHYGANLSPRFVALGDFNGATGLDIAVVNQTSNDVSVLLNLGNSTFLAREVFGRRASAGLVTNVAVGDFNGDGFRDTAITNQLVVIVHHGDGTGRLGPGAEYGVSASPIALTAGDFNGDGRSDLAVANANDAIHILIANSNGFNAAVPKLISGSITQIAVADLNADNKLDLALANYSTHRVTVLLGNGNGTFGNPAHFALADQSFPNGIAVGEFNGDGKPDVATADYNKNTISILLGNGSGAFGAPATFSVGSGSIGPTMVAVADFNGDGRSDLVANGSSGDIQILMGNGNGTFAPHVSYAADQQGLYLTSLAVGDFNTDGKPDVAVGGIIVLGNGDGTLAAPIKSHTSGLNVYAFPAVGDFNGDLRPDLALTEGSAEVTLLINTSTCPIVPLPPSSVTATATSTTTVGVAWPAVALATSYVVERKAPGGQFAPIGTPATASHSDTTASANTAYLYRVRAVNAAGSSPNSVSDLATTLIFTDDTLTGIPVKAVHLSELRTAVNAVRALAGLSPTNFTDAAAAGLTIKSLHVTQLRTAINSARSMLGLPAPAFTDSSLAGVLIKAVHFTQLRGRVQ